MDVGVVTHLTSTETKYRIDIMIFVSHSLFSGTIYINEKLSCEIVWRWYEIVELIRGASVGGNKLIRWK